MLPSFAQDGCRHAFRLCQLTAVDRSYVAHLVGHSLAHIERELILQTLRHSQGNRTRSAGLLGISIRSLRNKIRDYRNQGESVQTPTAPQKHCCAENGV
jgi:DNA-binding NtrC family response regulator